MVAGEEGCPYLCPSATAEASNRPQPCFGGSVLLKGNLRIENCTHQWQLNKFSPGQHSRVTGPLTKGRSFPSPLESLCQSLLPRWMVTKLYVLPWWLSRLKICLQCRGCGFGSWLRRILWRRTWQPTAIFLPGGSHRPKNLATIHSVTKESDTTEAIELTCTDFMNWHNTALILSRMTSLHKIMFAATAF